MSSSSPLLRGEILAEAAAENEKSETESNSGAEIEETPLLSPATSRKTVRTKVPEVELHLYRRGKGPIDVLKTSLGGWDQDQLEVRDILDKYGFKSLFAFSPASASRGVPIRFSPKNGRSILTYEDGSVVHVDGEPKMSFGTREHSSSDHVPWQNLRSTLLPLVHSLLDPHSYGHRMSSYTLVFRLLTGRGLLRLGRQVHSQMCVSALIPDAFLASRMVAMYGSCGDIASATKVFRIIRSPSQLLFNSIIRAYAWYGLAETAIRVFLRMPSLGFCGDHFTYPFVLKCCADLNSIGIGMRIHGLVMKVGLESDAYLGTSLINMYAKCGHISRARKVFEKLPSRDISSWNALIAGYMRRGEVRLAEDLFCRMSYRRNVVSWTAMISGYAQNGLASEALASFEEMLKEGIKPTWVTIMSVLPACSHSAELERGRRIHELAWQAGLGSDVSVKSALVAMYARCGSLPEARFFFDMIPPRQKDVVAWNTMITAYSAHGRGTDCVETFEEMVRAGVRPDHITFTALLSGCSHSGLIDLGIKYFNQMEAEYGVELQAPHCGCMVDMLGRVGRVMEAKEVIDQISTKAGPSAWGALLAACSKHRNLEIAEVAAKKLFLLEPNDNANFIHLANMYANAGMWKEVARVRSLAKARGMTKTPGCSWVEVHGNTYSFLCGSDGDSHPQAEQIREFLAAVSEKMRGAGYVADTSVVLHDISEEEKELNLITHSERLAIAFAILNTDPGTVIRVTKNLRICIDCHTAIKFTSMIFGREIIVRDLIRFHYFADGSCSCGDFW